MMPISEQQCVIYEAQCDTQDIAHVYEMLLMLTSELDCSALGVLNHDDDLLLTILCNKGKLIADYSCGMSFEEMYAEYDDELPDMDEEADEPQGQQKEEQARVMVDSLSEAFDEVNKEPLLEVLMQDFVFAIEAHEKLVEVVGLPECSIGLGYNHINEGQIEDQLDSKQLMQIGN
ncbi:hypothetical protein [Psychrobacter sp. C 20.9]|uniref:hypothetical protein n=1 Tax=Psychrobacter sp. C 20.9 TaxID=1926477 RepID=UPI00117B0E1B|nr:hypothetical protein [Psychrobacter sp. C 20.9]